jgi:hypothetical protein
MNPPHSQTKPPEHPVYHTTPHVTALQPNANARPLYTKHDLHQSYSHHCIIQVSRIYTLIMIISNMTSRLLHEHDNAKSCNV